MAKGVNKWIGIGNAVADPEMRYMPNGNAVANMSIACNDGYKDKNTGQMVDKTEFVRLVFFGKLGEIVGQYVKKGSKLYVEGKLQTRSWEQDGQKKFMTEIVCHEMQMLDSKGDNQGQQSQPTQSQGAAQSSQDSFDDSSDIPF